MFIRMLVTKQDKTKKILIIFFSILLLLIISKILFGLYKDKVENIKTGEEVQVQYDMEQPKNVMLEDYKKSNNFIYDMQVTLDTKESSKKHYRVIYKLRVTPKNNNIYKDMRISVFLDETMKNVFVVQNFLGFGTDINDKHTIDGKNNKGIEVARATYLSKELSKDELVKKLTSDIKVKVVWNEGIEWVKIPGNDIKFIER